jgi:hypothetical protein
MSESRYRQFKLNCGDSWVTCWLEDDPRLRCGRTITLKGIEGEWIIDKRYSLTVSERPETRWRVGGLE